MSQNAAVMVVQELHKVVRSDKKIFALRPRATRDIVEG